MKVSIVTTLYNSSLHMMEFYTRISTVVRPITNNYEIIFVNDGSPDNSNEIARDIVDADPKVKLIDLSRNFGHHKAVMAGLNHACGDLVFLIDCDLEEAPELLGLFYSEMKKATDLDVIYGVQKERKGGVIEKYGGKIFYKLFNKVSEFKVNEGALTVRLMSKRFVSSINKLKEKELYMAGLFEYVGFKTKKITVTKDSSYRTSYTLSKRIHLMISALVSFSSFPLVLSFYMGFLLAVTSVFFGIYLIVQKILYHSYIVSGWTSVMVSIWFLGGVLLMSTGIIGVYLSKIFNEVKNRPTYIVKTIYKNQNID
ncbi:MAG: glycosyltransferase family 2 protein [Xanthomonadales bacterium]|nr:glycosyltransferase family 2 protein [Xanthomonadales bacterium]